MATNVKYSAGKFEVFNPTRNSDSPIMPAAGKSVQILSQKFNVNKCSNYIRGKTFVFPLVLEHNYYHFHHNNMIRVYQSMVEAESETCAPNWYDQINATLNEQLYNKNISKDVHFVISGSYNNLNLFNSFYPLFSDYSYHTIDQIPENTCFEFAVIRDAEYGFWHKEGEGNPGDFRHLLIQHYGDYVVKQYGLDHIAPPTSPHICIVQRTNNRKIQNLEAISGNATLYRF